MPTTELQAGSIHYTETGPAKGGRPVVFVHGYLMGGDLWDQLSSLLAARGLRCFAPTWPLGAHRRPMHSGADLTPRGIAAIIASFLEHHQLEDVVLVGNDTGGALCQLVAVEHPERLGALVLTNCDAFENFPPSFFKALVAVAKVPGGLRAALAPMRTRAARRSPLGYGMLTHGDVDELAQNWVKPALTDPHVLDDLRRLTVALDPAVTLAAAQKLHRFERPVLLAWATDDSLFPFAHAERLAQLLPDARVERIEHSRAFSMIDQPERLAELVADFAFAGAPSRR